MREPEIDFKIISLTKVTCRPARWTVVIEKRGKQYTTVLDNWHFVRYESFVDRVLGQNSVSLTTYLRDFEWRALIQEAIDRGCYKEVEPKIVGRIEK